jgi:type IV pilus assembly protein PilQ
MTARKPNHYIKGSNTMINKWFSWIPSFILLGFFSLASTQVMGITLDDISYSALSGDRVLVKLELSEALQGEPLNFTIDNPARIALDFPGVGLNLAEKSQAIGIGMVHSVAAVEAAERTRVVLNLVRAVSYDISLDGNTVSVTMDSGVASDVDTNVSGRTGMAAAMASDINNIDFRRGDSGEGRIIVTLSDPSTAINMGQEGGKIVIDFLDTNLPSTLDRRLNVVDFATPVKEIDTSTYGNGARMVISTVSDEYDHLAYQSDDVYTIELKPLTKAELEVQKKEKFGFTGERLSLNFQSIEVRAVLQLIADFTGLNMVTSDSVGGNVTLRLKNVPWDQALDIILKSKGLGMRKAGNVIMVAPSEEIAAREKLELESVKQVEELAPMRTEFIQINYANAGDMAALISAEENNLLSERGTVTTDERTNTLIIQDVASSLEAVRGLITQLDIPVRQVLIESRIVNADETFAKDVGVRFGYSKNTKHGNALTRTDIGDNDPFVLLGGGKPGNLSYYDVQGTAFENPGGSGNESLLVDLPAIPSDAAALAIGIGKLGSYLLQLELSALIAEGRGEDIASPRVITSNQHEAIIESGTEIPYQEASSSGATSVSFKKAVLSLSVTPHITPDDRILLDLTVKQDVPSSTVVLGTPAIDTKAISTEVLVENGETIVLGGVYEQSDSQFTDRVPFFGDLPYVGFLFKRTDVDTTKKELLIFVTPKILKESLKI